MFFPESSPNNPADEVDSLVAKARHQHTSLCPSIATFLSNTDDNTAFLNVLTRHIELIKSRSQAFEDAHVTVYDKVLLALTRNGKFLESTPAIGFYCEEFLGVRNQKSSHALDMVKLEEAIKVPQTLTQGMACPGTIKAEDGRQSQAAISPPLTDRRPSTIEEDIHACTLEGFQMRTISLNTQRPPMEPKLARLWSIYDKARADYTAVADRNDLQSINAVKFLRDTAENTLGYLKNKNTDPVMMAELNATYNMAKNRTIALAGGKKRKFDKADMEDVRGTPKGPRRGPSHHSYVRGSNAAVCARRVAPSWEDAGNWYGGYSRGTRGERGSLARERGHSGIPFGYNRHVDSYHPTLKQYTDRKGEKSA